MRRRANWSTADRAALDRQIIEVLAADHPVSVRHLFYAMTNPRLARPVEKTELGYGRVQRAVLKLRRAGEVPYSWISDTTRQGYHVASYAGAGDFIARMAGFYRERLWTPDLPHVEVWCESRSIAGVLQDACRELAVSLYPSAGFSSSTLCWEAAVQIDRHRRERAIVLYVGDHDPAGVLIDRDIEKRLRSHLTTPLDFRRLAINPEQIAAFDLPTKPRKPGDRRRLDIRETVEAEAMPAAQMRRIVRQAVESYLPPGALQAARAAEESERAGLRALAGEIEELGGLAASKGPAS